MAKKVVEEEAGESVGLWYISFSDMITLLLSFFVMLSTFATYDKGSLEKIHNAWASIANYSIIPGPGGKDSMVSGRPPSDYTREGSEKAPVVDPAHPGHQAQPGAQPGSGDVYSDRRVFDVPSSRLFWGSGCSLMSAGRAHLKVLASLLRMVPCQVEISESTANASDEAAAARSLERAWTLVEYFTKEEAIPAERFRIMASAPAAAQRMNGQSVVEIVLLARGI